MRRRTATPDYLKECMGDALLELMKEKPFEKITIEEMTAKADVGRSTYFRYFKTKEEVLSFKVLAMYRRFSQDFHISHMDTDSDLMTMLTGFFSFWLAIRDTVEQVISTGHQHILFSAYKHIMEQARDEAGRINGYEQCFIMSGIFGVLYIWITTGYRESPEELADVIVHKVTPVFQ